MSAGSFPDADMLPIGKLLLCNGKKSRHSRLNKSEQRVMMTLWSIIRSPLMIGGHLPLTKKYAISLFTNTEIININQNSIDNKIIDSNDNYPIWYAKTDDYQYYALFNLDDRIIPYQFKIDTKGKTASEVWSGKEYEASSALAIKVPRHSVKLIRLK